MVSDSIKFIFISCLLITKVWCSGEDYSGLGKSLEELKNTLSEEQQNQAWTIIENPNLTKQEIKDQLNQYFQKLGEPFNSKYQQASKTFENEIASATAKAEAMKGSMSQPAQQLVDKIMGIHKDMTITTAQEKEQIKALINQATPDIKQELEKSKSQLQQKFGESIGNGQEII